MNNEQPLFSCAYLVYLTPASNETEASNERFYFKNNECFSAENKNLLRTLIAYNSVKYPLCKNLSFG